MNIIIFLIILAVLILAHEFGHFITAKRAGIRVDEFGLGFPPRLFGIRRGETLYSINLIPFGGFVKIFGEDPNTEAISGPDSKRSFINKPKLTQASVLAAGIAFNVIFAWLLISGALVSGLPASVGFLDNVPIKDPKIVLTGILKNAPAEQAGLKVGDVLKSLTLNNEILAGEKLSVDSAQSFIAAHNGQEITVGYERAGQLNNLTVTPTEKIDSPGVSGRAVIGISMDEIGTIQLPIHQAIWQGGKITLQTTGEVAVGLFDFISNAVQGKAKFSQVTGPVGIVGLVGDAAQFGILSLITFTAFISINLAVINILPFPALDGGRLFFLAIETIKRSPLNAKAINTANAVGFALLLILMLAVTYNDIIKLI